MTIGQLHIEIDLSQWHKPEEPNEADKEQEANYPPKLRIFYILSIICLS